MVILTENLDAEGKASNGYNGLRPVASDNKPADWIDRPAEIDNVRVDIDGHPVMQSWEAPYMADLARVAALNGGRVLEVGFGLGLSARSLQKYADLTVPNPVTEHLIIEANNDVFASLSTFADAAPSRTVRPVGPALWQTALHEISDGSIDGVLYDTYPLNREEQHTHQFDFITQIFPKLRDGAVLTYCNLTSLGVLRPTFDSWEVLFRETQLPHLLTAGFREEDISFEIFEIDPPADCEYYQCRTALVPKCVKRAVPGPHIEK